MIDDVLWKHVGIIMRNNSRKRPERQQSGKKLFKGHV